MVKVLVQNGCLVNFGSGIATDDSENVVIPPIEVEGFEAWNPPTAAYTAASAINGVGVLRESATDWKMWINTVSSMPKYISLSTSVNGTSWTNPPVLNNTLSAAYQNLPCKVIKVDNTYYLYHSEHTGMLLDHWVYTSTDLVTWGNKTKVNTTVQGSGGEYASAVIYRGAGDWVMYESYLVWPKWKIRKLTSTNGINWVQGADVIVAPGSDYIYSMSIVKTDINKYAMFYAYYTAGVWASRYRLSIDNGETWGAESLVQPLNLPGTTYAYVTEVISDGTKLIGWFVASDGKLYRADGII